MKVPLKDAIDTYERHLIKETLTKTHWDFPQTAKSLGLSLEELREKVRKYGLTPNLLKGDKEDKNKRKEAK